MRDMAREEIIDFIKGWGWGTLIGVEGDQPYAVEVSYGTDENYIYCGSKPGGRMAKCLHTNARVVFKICDSHPRAHHYTAVTIEGKAEHLQGFENIRAGARLVAQQAGLSETALDGIAQNISGHPECNFIRIPLKTMSGVIHK
jgi:nitroimidazol reductase NimA-like FMN-containing flavoprotein (pyridoxamine 5'-phosphate oxidase superfamily)